MVKSTYEILAKKYFNFDVDESWVEWAIEMMLRGFETEHLIELAGTTKPYNQFYLDELTSKVFSELSLDYSDTETVLTNYATYLTGEGLSGNKNYFDILKTLKDICVRLDYAKFLYDFYLLYFALDDLKYMDHQEYWPDADRENIHTVISEYFSSWQKDH